MKSDLYLKVILTVICAAVIVNLIMNIQDRRKSQSTYTKLGPEQLVNSTSPGQKNGIMQDGQPVVIVGVQSWIGSDPKFVMPVYCVNCKQ